MRSTFSWYSCAEAVNWRPRGKKDPVDRGALAVSARPDVFVRHWADELTPLEGGLVVDVGCGGGRNALYLARRDFRVLGIDLSRSRLDEAAALARRRHLDLALVQGSLGDIPLAAGSCAAILCTHVLESLPRQEIGPGLDEFHRLLGPQGQLLLITVAKEGSSPEEGEEVEMNTFLFRGHGTETRIHFTTRGELEGWLRRFRIREMVHQRWIVPLNVPLGGYWIVLAEKVP